jgi:hypothetical protein
VAVGLYGLKELQYAASFHAVLWPDILQSKKFKLWQDFAWETFNKEQLPHCNPKSGGLVRTGK